ncbi:hypothetical protein DFH29DRAFT_1004192 [Suillus ampliporus]|nr:hypothetical protein DFH29DRAFT_1004192 [Suillus ampliporus]
MKLERVLLQSLPESDSHSKAGSCGLLGRLIIVGPYVEGVDTAFPLDDRPRPKHRLPPATSINDISLSIISQTTLQQQRGGVPPPSRDSELRPNGKAKTNGKQANRCRHFSPENECYAAEQMPPPAKVPRSSTKHPFGDSPTSQPPSFASGRADFDSPRIRKTSKA